MNVETMKLFFRRISNVYKPLIVPIFSLLAVRVIFRCRDALVLAYNTINYNVQSCLLIRNPIVLITT